MSSKIANNNSNNPVSDPFAWMRNSTFNTIQFQAQAVSKSKVVSDITSAKAKEGSITLQAINLGKIQKRSTGAMMLEAAAQQGSGGQNSDKAPDSYRFQLINIPKLNENLRKRAEKEENCDGSPGPDDEHFNIKSYQRFNSTKPKEVEALKKAIGEEEAVKLIGKLTGNAKNAWIPKDEVTFGSESPIYVSYFDKGTKEIPFGAVVEVIGVICEYSTYTSKKTKELVTSHRLQCSSICISDEDEGDVEKNLTKYGFLGNGETAPQFDPSKSSVSSDYGTKYVIFEDTLEEPNMNGRGVRKALANDTSKDQYVYKNVKQVEYHKADYKMFQQQWGEEGFNGPKSEVMIMTSVLNWFKTDQNRGEKVTELFGIPDEKDWKEFMPFQRIPLLVVGNINQEKTMQINGPIYVLNSYGNYMPLMSKYLCNMCAQVSKEFVLETLYNKSGSFNLNNNKKPNLMNAKAVEQIRGKKEPIMTGNVVAISSWDGHIDTLTDAKCEFRVMINQPLELLDMLKLARLPIQEAEKVLRKDPSAQIKLSAAPMMYFYAVKQWEPYVRKEEDDNTPEDMEVEQEKQEEEKKPSSPKREVNEDGEDDEEDASASVNPKKKLKLTKKKKKKTIKPKK